MDQDTEELEILDASEVHARRLTAKEIFTPKDGEHSIFLIADGTVKLSGGDHGIRKSHFNTGSIRLRRRAQWRSSRKVGRVSNGRNDG